MALVLLAGCGGSVAQEVTGVVVDFDGDITTVHEFVLRTPDGEDLRFLPAEDLVFHGSALGHIGEHGRTGIPVRVRYTMNDAGRLIAEEIFDAG